MFDYNLSFKFKSIKKKYEIIFKERYKFTILYYFNITFSF